MNVAKSWKRILAWHKANTPAGTFSVSHGATRQELLELESLIGTTMPKTFRESYILHNGTARTWLLHHGSLHTLDGIATEWRMYSKWQEENGYGTFPTWHPTQLESMAIKPIWWGPLRLPITDNGGGDPVTLDFDPAEDGSVGQVIKFNHEVGPINILAYGFGEWLDGIASELEAGKYIYDEDESMVWPLAWSDR